LVLLLHFWNTTKHVFVGCNEIMSMGLLMSFNIDDIDTIDYGSSEI
jgi:hypothetical protein